MESKIVVPNLGESVIEATVLRWLKQPGEPVKAGEPLVELETDKVNLEVSAERDGILLSADRKEGEDVKVGDVLGKMGEANGDGQVTTPEKPVPGREEVKAQDKEPESSPASPQPVVPDRVESKLSEQKEEKITPVARRFAEENGLDLTKVEGSGAQGRITRQDLEAFVQKSQPPPKPSQEVALPMEPQASRIQPQPARIERMEQPQLTEEDREERLRMSRRRRTIAQNLVQAQQNAALLSTFNDVDMSAVMEIRKARKEAFKQKFGVSLGIASFFVKASILALKDYPRLNAEIQGDDMILKYHYDIGVAIGAEEGLVVPVLRDADRMTFVEIEKAIQGFAKKAKEGTLSLVDLQGGTFTITNGGVYGSLLSTPIINAPQVGILGLHRIEDRPVARDGSVVIRPMMYLAVTYDHRIVDGREAVQFLVRVKEVIENPELMLLEL